MINYCNEAQVASALAMNPTTTLSQQANVGDTTIKVTAGTFYPGQRLALDHFQDDTVGEVVFVKTVSGTTLTLVNAVVNQHVLGAPVVEVTAITKTLAAASRMVDDITYYSDVGFNQETRTETRMGYLQNDGSVFFSVRKPSAQTITSISVQNTPLDPVIAVPSNQWMIDAYNVTAYLQNTSYVPPASSRQVQVTVTYQGGYTPLPDVIVRASIVFAARFFKEKDSGFADVIGNTDLGVLQYKKGVPAEVLALIKPYIRSTP